MIFISVICPVYNEAEYIRDIMEFFIKAQPEEKELIIIDGGSTDKTKEIVSGYSEKYPQIRLIENPDKYVPFALNTAILNSTGDPVIRLDAHTLYAPDYFTKIIETFNRTDADIAGGPMRAIGNSDFQKAVAIATSTSFGVGDSAFHDETFEGYTDSVYLGSWRRTVFKDVGLFDTDMIRNQDDEFHYRAKSMGKKIYLNPEIKSWYYPRGTVASLFSQYFQYGLFKPLVLRKVKSGMRLRHLVPSGFVIYLAVLILFNKFTLIYVPGLFYILLSLLFAVINSRNVLIALNMMLVYPVVHLAYGLGFIKGLITLWTGKKPSL